jgi:hypothetical protein
VENVILIRGIAGSEGVEERGWGSSTVRGRGSIDIF